jgi:hypothetical protein
MDYNIRFTKVSQGSKNTKLYQKGFNLRFGASSRFNLEMHLYKHGARNAGLYSLNSPISGRPINLSVFMLGEDSLVVKRMALSGKHVPPLYIRPDSKYDDLRCLAALLATLKTETD